MPTFAVELTVTPRPGVRDPQGEAVQEVLHSLGHRELSDCVVGRVLRLSMVAVDEEAARALVGRLCDEILVNPSLETFTLRLGAA